MVNPGKLKSSVIQNDQNSQTASSPEKVYGDKQVFTKVLKN